MTVEEIRGNMGGERENYDNFPVGMRVLAVDDDPICLKLLDGLLRKCQYHVTTTSQARSALKMLRENKDRFDLVISDVHMPDMDGFKLLELVGLEMDLPVIMLSANSDSKLVMKGITHGACDYLVKPVRLEELKNIWQHVIRRKKVEPKKQNKSDDQDKAHQGGGEGERGSQVSGNADQNGKVNKKRKDEEYESDENGNDDEDPGTQKKPRVVWAIELHKKFVTAVHQLGLEKAVPKRILDLMNVEGLTRENVASHLQKYRLFLKRINAADAQQANLAAAALGGKDSAYMRMGSLDGLGGFRTLAGSGRFGQASLSSSYASGGMLGRLNSPSGVSLRNLASTPILQPNHGQNMSNNSLNALMKFNANVPPASQNANFFQGIPASLELDQLQQSKCATHIGELNPLDESGLHTVASTFTNSRLVGSANSSMPNEKIKTKIIIMASSQAALLLQKQLKDLNRHPVDGFSAGLVDENNVFEWSISIIGPPETLFDGGFFNATMSFPTDYPNNPPTVKFTTEIWHPNVYSDGRVCISILHPPGDDPNHYELASERWTPVHTVESIMLSIISMLTSPNDESPANVDAAKEWRDNRAEFVKKVKRCVRKSQEML